LNYYERHIGDYIKKTAHLSLLEHGIYTRLLDVYYDREEPLPEDKVARLVGARTEPETQALQLVLQEFFELRNGLWCNSRCDEEIAAYSEGEPEREVKKANEGNRLKRHREERAELFKVLVSMGEHAPWNIGISELRERVSALQERTPETQPATAPATPATATQTPLPIHQTPDKKEEDTPYSPPDEGDAPPTKRKRVKTAERTLGEWLAAIKATEEKAIPTTDAVFTYAREIGLPAEFLHIAWFEFKARYTADPVKGQRQKTYADWRAVFRKAVREGWLKLWYLDGQQYALTAAGQQAQRAVQAQHREGGEA
jgi:uncharacterized protein YdaU (DUF1376 family)